MYINLETCLDERQDSQYIIKQTQYSSSSFLSPLSLSLSFSLSLSLSLTHTLVHSCIYQHDLSLSPLHTYKLRRIWRCTVPSESRVNVRKLIVLWCRKRKSNRTDNKVILTHLMIINGLWSIAMMAPRKAMNYILAFLEYVKIEEQIY